MRAGRADLAVMALYVLPAWWGDESYPIYEMLIHDYQNTPRILPQLNNLFYTFDLKTWIGFFITYIIVSFMLTLICFFATSGGETRVRSTLLLILSFHHIHPPF